MEEGLHLAVYGYFAKQ